MTTFHYWAPPSGQRFSFLTVRAQVLLAVSGDRWATAAEIGNVAGLSRNATAKALELMLRDRLVQKRSETSGVSWRISTRGFRALDALRRMLQEAARYQGPGGEIPF